MSDNYSEYGKGFTYCIGLFLCHAERFFYPIKGNDRPINYELWFNGAADHLFELVIPENFSNFKECSDWRARCMSWRLSIDCPEPTEEDFVWAVQKAKDFLRAWDEQCGIKTTKGEWE